MKNTTQQLLTWKWTGPIDKRGKFHWLKWVKLAGRVHQYRKGLEFYHIMLLTRPDGQYQPVLLYALHAR